MIHIKNGVRIEGTIQRVIEVKRDYSV